MTTSVSFSTSVASASPKIIQLHAVRRPTRPLSTVEFNEAVHQYCSRQLHSRTTAKLQEEACAKRDGLFIADVAQHPFIEAVHRAFACHLPLLLSPQAVWLLIAQGFALHVNANAEALRPKLVGHAGKLELKVTRNDFVRHSPQNHWPEVFAAFSDQIREHLKLGAYDLITRKYSTTTDDDVAVTQIVLMEAVKSYFDLMLQTLCGIPEIHLEGTASDWRNLVADARALCRFDLDWWTPALIPVLEQIVAAAEGEVDEEFWASIYKYQTMSGGPFVNGWINVFFPYLNGRIADDTTQSRAFRRRGFGIPSGVTANDFSSGKAGSLIARHYQDVRTTTEDFPTGLSVAPFKWRYLGSILNMQFIGGFVAVCQDPDTFALRPELGWLVAEVADPLKLNE